MQTAMHIDSSHDIPILHNFCSVCQNMLQKSTLVAELLARGKAPQVVFLAPAALQHYLHNACLPADGAFIEDIKLPCCKSLADLRTFLVARLAKLEDYRARVRRTSRRAGALGNIYVQWFDGPVSQLMEADAIVADSEVRLKPTEDTRLATFLDTSVFSSLPATAIEGIAEHADSQTLLSLRELSTAVAAQHVSRPVRRVLVEVDW